MKLRFKDRYDLFDATLLVDDPECSDLGYPATIRILGHDGEYIFASPQAASSRCTLVWATFQERQAMASYGFFAEAADA
ncbi:hypothetical protein AYO44_14090 [Planctomycetaceae bacterium SCGC AG-212-F19]|nr:hypothetical protein AYO44_14090 [Planctomycetaceae bacterium SCGC AG-212-F19]